jgi:hypothetical protein
MDKLKSIKEQIICALSHPEAESGLYLNNLIVVHEDEERTPVTGSEIEVLDALKELLEHGTVSMNEEGESVIFYLSSSSQPILSRKS